MKRLILIIIIAITAITCNAQLNNTAESVRTNNPRAYNVIKKHAIDKWDSDHKMILYTINQQCDAMYEILTILSDDITTEIVSLITIKAMKKWAYDGYESSVEKQLTDNAPILELDIDWRMVVYTVKKQLEASLLY